MVASHTPPTGDLAHNLGMCPDWELNWQPFGLQGGTQSTEPHQPVLNYFLNFVLSVIRSQPLEGRVGKSQNLVYILKGSPWLLYRKLYGGKKVYTGSDRRLFQ